MPIYEYRCDNGHTFEVLQKMTDDPVAVCESCEAPVRRVLHPVAVHFKGSGFYNTDYGKSKRGREAASAEGSGDGGADKNKAAEKAKTVAKDPSGSGSASSNGGSKASAPTGGSSSSAS